MSSELFVTALVTFFVVIDPIGVTPIFAGLTADSSSGHKRLMAFKSVIIATGVLIGFAFGGEWLFNQLHVSLDAFRAAGGVLLFLLALEMLFERRAEKRESRVVAVREVNPDIRDTDVSVFPLAIPLIAGPGSIASVMLLMAEDDVGAAGQAQVLAAMGVNLALCLVLFLLASVVMRLIGQTLAAMITRILGVILAALSAQFIIDGVAGAVTSYLSNAA